jgi:sulfopyruvate decarboxylase subunit beta
MMKPEECLRAIAAVRGDAVCVPTMTTAPAWREIAPNDLSVTCAGFMGGAASLGLGIALGEPERRVIILDGDGSLLMQLGSLAAIAGAAPKNLVHMVFKNCVYQTSGCQEVPGGACVDFVAIARGAGYRNGYGFTDLAEFTKNLDGLLSQEGPTLVELRTELAECTPITAGFGPPFHQQAAELRARLAQQKTPTGR